MDTSNFQVNSKNVSRTESLMKLKIELENYLGKIVICPRCGKPGILTITRVTNRKKDKTYEYYYVVVLHHNYAKHIVCSINNDKMLDIALSIIRKLKFIEVR